MSILLVKIFENIKAIPVNQNPSPLSTQPADTQLLRNLIQGSMSQLSKSYAQAMPDWVTAKYFDPSAERERLLLHDYQQTEIRKMRSMDGTKLVDCLEFPLKSLHDLVEALKYMLQSGLSFYVEKFLIG